MALRMAIDHETFLTEYWQKRPLLLRNAIDPDRFRVPADELAGLACEPEVESRLVIERSATDWEVRHGPFDSDEFANLPTRGWTLLVQDVDKYRPDVADLLDLFDFLPAWQIDDIMISYATDQGGVGPHSDAYDVFLMQGAGRRRWRLSHRAYNDQDLVPGLDLRILRRFETDADWTLGPGDLLYLPPQVAHWGTAVGECMTYSLGFRVPSQRDLATDWCQHVLGEAADRPLRAETAPTREPERLEAEVIAAARDLIEALPRPKGPTFVDWLGRSLTDPKPQFQIDPPDPDRPMPALQPWFAEGHSLLRHPWARLCWTSTQDGRVQLFFNGNSQIFEAEHREAVALICRHRRLTASLFSDGDLATAGTVLSTLVSAGILEAESGS